MYKMICSLLLCLFAGCSTVPDQNTLTVGTNAEFFPFSFREGKEITGFDVDIAKEVSQRLNKKLLFKDMPFDALLPDLLLGNIDFIAAGMTYTEERAKRVAFTKPYLNDDPLIIISDKYDPQKGLDGLVIAVNEGYTADLFLSKKKELDLIRLNSPADAFLALKNHRCDAFVSAKSTVQAFLQAEKFKTYDLEGPKENCALVIAKDNLQLLEAIQTALDSMEEDGTIAKLKTKWGL